MCVSVSVSVSVSVCVGVCVWVCGVCLNGVCVSGVCVCLGMPLNSPPPGHAVTTASWAWLAHVCLAGGHTPREAP